MKKYLSKLDYDKQKSIIKKFYKLNKINNNYISFRFKLLDLNTTDNNKAYLLKLYDIFSNLDTSSQEYFKYKIFFDTITNIPFSIYSNLNINKYNNNNNNYDINDYLIYSKKNLDSKIYGHIKLKILFYKQLHNLLQILNLLVIL